MARTCCDGWGKRFPRAIGRSLRLERLEPRLLLSTFSTATTSDGTTSGTLRAAIIAANANLGEDTIILSSGTYRLTLANDASINNGIENECMRGDLDVTDSLTIQGAGRDVTVIDAQGIDRVLQNFSYLCLRDLTITGGLAGNGYEYGGGGILGNGELVLVNCHVTGNTASTAYPSGNLGGGIFTSGPLTLTNTIVSNNSSVQEGGGVYSNYRVTFRTNSITGCMFNDNRTINGSGGGLYTNGGVWSIGGSVFSANSGLVFSLNDTVTLTDSAFTNDSPVRVGNCSATISNCTFSGNTKQGALWLGSGSGSYTQTVSNCTFTNNSAAGASGGAITIGPWNYGTDYVTISNSTFTGNTGGAVFGGGTITGCTFAGNTGNGALHLVNRATITDCSFSGNSRSNTGGAIYLAEDNPNLQNCSVTINRSTFSHNQTSGKGGAICNYAQLTLNNCTFTGNTAGTDGGALYTEVLARIGGDPPAYHYDPYLAALNNCTFSGNAAGGSGGGVHARSEAKPRNTIAAVNSATVAGPDVAGSFSSQGSNLIGKSDGSTGFVHGVNGDLVGTAAGPIDPLLGPLQDNGGPTQTMALLAGSPAIDAGNNAGVAATDQRGFARILDGNRDGTASADIGAFEFFEVLGPIDFRLLPSQSFSGGEVWYQVTTRYNGLLTVDALSETVEITLFGRSLAGPQTSTAVNGHQRLDQAVLAGQIFFIRLAGTVQSGEVRIANLVQHQGANVTVRGTAENDTLVFEAGSPACRLTIHGLTYPFTPAQANAFFFDGLAGADEVRVVGSGEVDTATLRPSQACFRGTGYMLAGVNIESSTFDGGGGEDLARLYGSRRADFLTCSGAGSTVDAYRATFSGGIAATAAAEKIYVEGNGSKDAAELRKSVETDIFVPFWRWARMAGEGHACQAHRFRSAIARDSAGEPEGVITTDRNRTLLPLDVGIDEAILVDAVVDQATGALTTPPAMDDLAEILWFSEYERRRLKEACGEKTGEPNQVDLGFAGWE